LLRWSRDLELDDAALLVEHQLEQANAAAGFDSTR
jgi:hypothetical protein